jgi:hypothetical protein
MIRDIPRDRLTAAELLDQIQQYDGDHVYYGLCCNGEESNDGSSYQGLVLEKDTVIANGKEGSAIAPLVDMKSDTVVLAASQCSQKQLTEHEKVQLQNGQTAIDP